MNSSFPASSLLFALLPSHILDCCFSFTHSVESYTPLCTQWPGFSNTITTCATLVVASLILISLTMIPRYFWRAASSTPDSSATSSIQYERKTEKGPSYKSVFHSRRKLVIAVGIIILLFGLVLGLSLGLTLGLRHGHDTNNTALPVVNLGYSRYQGNNFQHGVNQWLGIRYAAAPLGELRFAVPQDPPYNATLQKASKVG